MPDQRRKLGKAPDDMIGRRPQLVDGRAGTVDPERAETERFRPARIPAVARNEAYRLLRHAKPFHREPVHRRRRLVDFRWTAPEARADQAAKSGVRHARP